jgi:hypothetical protein
MLPQAALLLFMYSPFMPSFNLRGYRIFQHLVTPINPVRIAAAIDP